MGALSPGARGGYNRFAVRKGPEMIGALRDLVIVVLDLYTYVIIAAVIVSWLVGFGVINTYNQFARMVVKVLHALTEPVFGPIRRILPSMGGLDLSPLIVLLLIFFLQRWLIRGTLL
jgi:YggT family protein